MFSVIDFQFIVYICIYKSFPILITKSYLRLKDVVYPIKCFFLQRYLFPESCIPLVPYFRCGVFTCSIRLYHIVKTTEPLQNTKRAAELHKAMLHRDNYAKAPFHAEHLGVRRPDNGERFVFLFRKKRSLFSVHFLILGKVFMYSLGE